jgi:hypothetical protein
VRLDRRAVVTALAAAAPLSLAVASGGTPDGNERYLLAYAAAEATRGPGRERPPRLPEALAERLRGGQVIFVGGLLKRFAEAISSVLTQPIGFGGYFDEQREALELQGIATTELDIPSEADIASNAAAIAAAIRASPVPVTLITHSKGSLDLLAALIAEPDLCRPARVQAWVSLQAPFYGSPLADLNTGDPILRAITGYLLEKGFGGSPDTLLELRVSSRRVYQRVHAGAIRSVVEAVPTVCYGSQIASGQPSLFRVTWLVCRLAGEPDNDGLVGIRSARLPGAVSVVEDGVDHAMAVIKVPGSGPFDPATCLTALLTIALA